MPKDDRNVIAHLEERLAQAASAAAPDAMAEFELLADLYVQAGSCSAGP